MNEVLILVSIIILASVVLSNLSHRLGIPVLFAFILLGMFFGESGPVNLDFDDFVLTEKISSTALIIIMFYGGFGTNWKRARKVAAQSIVLASAGVILTALLTGAFCHYVLGFNWLEAMLLGSVVASTDAASVFSILRSNNLTLKEHTDSLLELESGSNDPTSYMLTVIVLTAMLSKVEAGGMLKMLVLQVGLGLGLGFLISKLTVMLLDRINISSTGLLQTLLLAIAVVAYALPQMLGGNGYLSTYIVGIHLGNHEYQGKKEIVSFFDGLTSLTQIVIFFLLGLVSSPSALPGVFLTSLAVMLFMTFISRPISVFGLMAPFKGSLNQKLIVSWAGIRGAASIVFAITTVSWGVQLDNDIFHMVFMIVLLSLSIQGGLLPLMSKKTKMYEAGGDIGRTFSDYEEEHEVQFIESLVRQGNPWIGKNLSELNFPEDLRIVMLEKSGRVEIATGQSVIEEGDSLVLSAISYNKNPDIITMKEVEIDEEHEWVNKKIRDLDIAANTRILILLRGKKTVIPSGDWVIETGDKLVMSRLAH